MEPRGGYAVVDVETSGFSPTKNRIVEVGLVLVDESGEAVYHWGSRLNPQGPVGPTHVHGIRAEDVVDAPLFADVAQTLASLLSGHVFVAHNVRFDLSFLLAEFERAGWDPPPIPALCTQEASWYYQPELEKHRLLDCCSAAGVVIEQEHSALSDARATAMLLQHFLSPEVPPPPLSEHLELPRVAVQIEWPKVATRMPQAWDAKAVSIRRGATVRRPVMSAPLMKALDEYALREAIEAGAPESAKAYLELLLVVLEDGVLTVDEGFSLTEVSAMYGLSRDEIKHAHRGFLTALAHKALVDESVSRQERDEMRQIALLLDMPDELVTTAISDARRTLHERQASAVDHSPLPADWNLGEPLRVGDRVAFTGCDPEQRAALEAGAKAKGVRVTSSVSAKTAMLVTDGGFSGNKAAAAEAAGTRLVHPDDFSILLRLIQPPRDDSRESMHAPSEGSALSKECETGVTRRPAGNRVDGADGDGASDAPSLAEIRAWARRNGLNVGKRGRLHQNVIDAYNARSDDVSA